MKRSTVWIVALTAVLCTAGRCGDGGGDGDDESDAGGTGANDGDTDGDGDTDADGDADGDGDTDADGDVDTGADTGTDTDSETGTGTDTDSGTGGATGSGSVTPNPARWGELIAIKASGLSENLEDHTVKVGDKVMQLVAVEQGTLWAMIPPATADGGVTVEIAGGSTINAGTLSIAPALPPACRARSVNTDAVQFERVEGLAVDSAGETAFAQFRIDGNYEMGFVDMTVGGYTKANAGNGKYRWEAAVAPDGSAGYWISFEDPQVLWRGTPDGKAETAMATVNSPESAAWSFTAGPLTGTKTATEAPRVFARTSHNNGTLNQYYAVSSFVSGVAPALDLVNENEMDTARTDGLTGTELHAFAVSRDGKVMAMAGRAGCDNGSEPCVYSIQAASGEDGSNLREVHNSTDQVYFTFLALSGNGNWLAYGYRDDLVDSQVVHLRSLIDQAAAPIDVSLDPRFLVRSAGLNGDGSVMVVARQTAGGQEPGWHRYTRDDGKWLNLTSLAMGHDMDRPFVMPGGEAVHLRGPGVAGGEAVWVVNFEQESADTNPGDHAQIYGCDLYPDPVSRSVSTEAAAGVAIRFHREARPETGDVNVAVTADPIDDEVDALSGINSLRDDGDYGDTTAQDLLYFDSGSTMTGLSDVSHRLRCSVKDDKGNFTVYVQDLPTD